MSLFGFLKKKEKEPVIIDKVWMNQKAKELGCLAHVGSNPGATLIAWSSLTFDRFQKYLNEENGLAVEIMMAGLTMPNRMKGREICFLEHHLFLKKEIEMLQSWKCEKAVFLNSLTDPVFYTLNPDRILLLMEKMGMEENELIEHAMVTKSIKRAQQKMEKERMLPEMSPAVKDWWKHIR